MSFSATIPVAQVESANAALEAAGFGPNNFSTPLRTGTAEATHAGLHCIANYPAFRAAVAAIANVQITDGAALATTFAEHCTTQALEWTDPTNWQQNPVMTGDIRSFGGRDYRSLIDYNVWPTSYRALWEDLGGSVEAWVQPTGAHDAYPLNAVVTHNGVTYRSTIPANVTVPGENVIFGWWVIVP